MASAVCKVSVEGGSEETFEYICTSCKETKIVKAEKYCQDCDELYCLVCVDLHKRFPALKNHVILDRGYIENWKKQTQHPVLPTETCNQHPGKLVELFCGQHKELCCHICVSLNHRICEGMLYIAEAAKGIDKSKEFKAVKDNLWEIKADLNMSTSKQQACLEKSRCKMLEQIAEFRNRTNEVFDDLEKKVTDEMDTLFRYSSSKHIEYKKACDDIVFEIQHLQQLLESTPSTNEPQTFINMKKCQFQVPRVNRTIEELPSQHADDQLLFEIDSKLESFFASLESIGTVKVKRSTSRPVRTIKSVSDSGSYMTPLNVQFRGILPLEQHVHGIPSTGIARSQTSDTTQPQEVSPLKVSRYEKYNIKLKSDKKRCIVGICILFDGSVLVSDFGNRNIKRLNTSYQISHHLDIPSQPRQMCPINKHEIVVASTEKTLTFVSIQKKHMKIIKSMQIDQSCHGVAYNCGKLYVSSDTDAVCILTRDGTFLRTIRLDNNKQSIFSRTRNLMSSPDGSKIFIADDNKGLVTLNTKGEVLSTYKDSELLGAEYVFADVHGHVLVCYHESKQIMQMNIEGTKAVTEIVKLKSYENPSHVCIDHDRKKMLVSIHNNNYIRVYDII